jgi:hypothetical protein
LRDRAREQSTGRKPFYFGIDVVTDLCSGDIATILLVADRIFSRAAAAGITETPVPDYIQNEAIRDTAKELVEHTHDFHPLGENMYDLVMAFGQFVRRVMISGEQLGKSRAIPQIPRIEVDNEGLRLPDSLNDENRQLFLELLRRSVFIEMDTGHSRHRNMPTLRLQFRRIFLPHFMAGLGKNDALKISANNFAEFLSDPAKFLNVDLSRRGLGDAPAQLTLSGD